MLIVNKLKRIVLNRLVLLLSTCLLLVLFVDAANAQKSEKLLEKDFYLIESSRQLHIGSLPVAYTTIQKAIEFDSLCAACHYLQSQILVRLNQPKESLAAIQKAYAIDSTNRWYLLTLARLSAINSELAVADTYYAQYISNYEYDSDVFLDYSNILLALGQEKRARDLLDTLSSREGFSEPVALVRQQFFYRTNNFDEAYNEALTLLSMNPENPQYITLLGDILSRKSDFKGALGYYERALEIDSTFLPAELGILDVYRNLGEYDKFFSLLNKVVQNPQLSLQEKLQYLLLVVSDSTLSQVGKTQIDSILQSMKTLYGNSWQYVYFTISYYMNIGRVELALQYIQSYISENKPSIESTNTYLSILQSAGLWDDLIVESDKAMKIFKDDFALPVFKAVAYWQKNDLKSALKTLEKSTKVAYKANDSTILQGLLTMQGDIYQQLGDHKKSFSFYDKALEINPNSAMVLNNYAYYLAELDRDLPKALKMSKKVVEIEPNNPTYIDTYAWVYYKMGLYDEAKVAFRSALSHGGRKMSVLLDHYADVLYKLGDYDTALMYWEFALEAEDCTNPEKIKEKIANLKAGKK